MSGQMPYFMENKNKTLLANKIKVETAAKTKKTDFAIIVPTRSVKGMSSWFTIKPHTLKYEKRFILMLHSRPVI